MKCFGEKVLEGFSLSTIEIGQCVTEKAMRECCTKMASYEELAQEIAPCGHRFDNSVIRTIHHTFSRADKGIWQYKGKCFFGESVERGTDFREG